MQYAFEEFGGGHHAKTKDELIEYLRGQEFDQSTILVKASRGMALEDVVDYL